MIPVPEVYYADHREIVKARIAQDPLVLEYVERLEHIAHLCYALWVKGDINHRDADTLYDALAPINFLDPTL